MKLDKKRQEYFKAGVKPWSGRVPGMDVIIFEDDRDFARLLESYIRTSFKEFTITLNTYDQNLLQRYITASDKPSIYFLDIIIEERAVGMEVFQWLDEKNGGDVIIFISDYPDMIWENPYYKIHAFNYIAKGGSFLYSEINRTLGYAAQYMKEKQLFIHVNKFRRIAIPLYGIRFVESGTGKEKEKVVIHHEMGVFKMRGSLKGMEYLLDDSRFIRIHRSFIINKCHIKRVDGRNQVVILRGGGSCPFSWRHKKELDDWLSK